MSDSSIQSRGGIGFAGALFILFLGLRLTDHIDWSWYWVASPLLAPLALLAVIIGVGIPIIAIRSARASRRARTRGATCR